MMMENNVALHNKIQLLFGRSRGRADTIMRYCLDSYFYLWFELLMDQTYPGTIKDYQFMFWLLISKGSHNVGQQITIQFNGVLETSN